MFWLSHQEQACYFNATIDRSGVCAVGSVFAPCSCAQPGPRASSAALPSSGAQSPGGVPEPRQPQLPGPAGAAPAAAAARGSVRSSLCTRKRRNSTRALIKMKTQTETCTEAFGSQRDCEMGPVSQIFGKSEQLYEYSVPAYEESSKSSEKTCAANITTQRVPHAAPNLTDPAVPGTYTERRGEIPSWLSLGYGRADRECTARVYWCYSRLTLASKPELTVARVLTELGAGGCILGCFSRSQPIHSLARAMPIPIKPYCTLMTFRRHQPSAGSS